MTAASAFSGRVAFVAGGTGGLGRSVSLAFLEAGATVVVTYRKKEELDRLKAEAGASAALEGQAADVTEEAAARSLVDGVFARHGRLDALVNAVGGYAGGAKLWESEAGSLDAMLNANLRPCYVLARAAVPRMVAQAGGSIVNVVSRAAVDHGAGQAAYAASKAAALALTDSLAEDLRGTGVRANSILPSIIDTEANRRAMPKADFTRWPKPAEIAKVILFLCGDDAAVIHGAAIPVYGYC